MPQYNPDVIARIALAVEFTDGRRVTIYSEDPATVVLDTQNDVEDHYGRLYIADSVTSIEIGELRNYTIYYGQAETDLILDQTQKQIGGGK